MIAQPDSTAETMERALAYSIAALASAVRMDIDRTDADRQFFTNEQYSLQVHFNNVSNAQLTLKNHILSVMVLVQSQVGIGDDVLDRGLSEGKKRTNLELARTKSEAADTVFGKDISDLTDAPLRMEPELVMQMLQRFDQAPDFAGKSTLREDLERRAAQQQQALSERAAGELTRISLKTALEHFISDASETLYRLEKRLLDRFPRKKTYIKKFFMDTSYGNSSRKKAPTQPPAQP